MPKKFEEGRKHFWLPQGADKTDRWEGRRGGFFLSGTELRTRPQGFVRKERGSLASNGWSQWRGEHVHVSLCVGWESTGRGEGRRVSVQFRSVQSLSCVWFFVTSWPAACQASLSITNSRSLLKLMSIASVMPSNHLILCCPLLLLPSILPSMMVFSIESVLCIRWPKYWSFSFSISSSNEYSGLISFRMDWLDLLAVQGTVNSLQHHHSKASILWCSAFFVVQLSYPYITTGKTIGLTRWTFVGEVVSLLFNMLSRFVIAFLPRSKCLLISWLM